VAGKPSFRFAGFYLPRYTPVPDDLFDQLLPLLSGAELKVLLYVMRRTFGFKREADNISLTQICQGIRRRDGSYLDHGTGLHRETAVTALRSLEEKNIIVAVRHSSPDKGFEATTYTLNLILSTDPTLVGKSDQGESEIPTRASREIRPGLVGNSDLQETVLQETDQEIDHSNIRMVSTAKADFYDEDRQTILAYVDDIARELADGASLKSSTTRALNVFRHSGVSLDAFTAALLRARAIVKERSASIKTTTQEPGRPFPTKRKMGYFFAVLEDCLGLKEDGRVT